MYDTENRIVTVDIDGKTYELLCTTRATMRMASYFKSLKVLKKSKSLNPEKGFDYLLFMFMTLHNEALRFRAYETKNKYTPMNEFEAENIVNLKNMKLIGDKIKEATIKAGIVDVQTENKTKNM